MVVLRPTRKLRALLPPGGTGQVTSDTALGDWYVNPIVVDRRPLLILVSAASLLPMLLPARNVRDLPKRLSGLVDALLRRSGVPARAIEAEIRAMDTVTIAPTADRSVLGIMIDFAKTVPYHLEAGGWEDADLVTVEARLAETPCYACRRNDKVLFPDRKARELLRAKWGSG